MSTHQSMVQPSPPSLSLGVIPIDIIGGHISDVTGEHTPFIFLDESNTDLKEDSIRYLLSGFYHDVRSKGKICGFEKWGKHA